MPIETPYTTRDVLIWSWVSSNGDPGVVINPYQPGGIHRLGDMGVDAVEAIRDDAIRAGHSDGWTYLTIMDTPADYPDEMYRMVCGPRCAWRSDVLMPVIRYRNDPVLDMVFSGRAPTVAIIGRKKGPIPDALSCCFVITYLPVVDGLDGRVALWQMTIQVGDTTRHVATGTAYEIARITCCATDVLFVPNAANIEEGTLANEILTAFVRTQNPSHNWTRRTIFSARSESGASGEFSGAAKTYPWLSVKTGSFASVAEAAHAASEAWCHSRRKIEREGSDDPRAAWKSMYITQQPLQDVRRLTAMASAGGQPLVEEE